MQDSSGKLVIGQGESAQILQYAGEGLAGRRIAIVTDREVGAFHQEGFSRPLLASGAKCCPVVVDISGSAKSLDAVKVVLSHMSDNGFLPGDLVIGLGGGGVMDVARFSAYLYRGGLETIMIPTSLSSMVAVGSIHRACLNFSGTKDMLSIPAAACTTIIDPAILDTLPKRQYANGIAEIVRLAYLADRSLLERIETGEGSREELVRHAIEASAAALAGNPAYLGFGRQFGDVIEEHFRFIKYSYGEVCALGMLAVSPSGRLSAVLEKYGLPLRLEGVGAETLSRKMVKAFFPAVPPGPDAGVALIAFADEPGYPGLRPVLREEADAYFAAAVTRIAG